MEALEQLLGHASELGANGVVGLRYESSDLGDGATEVLCYGTAVLIVAE